MIDEIQPPPAPSGIGEDVRTALDRSTAQFFFEIGFGSCWAEAFIRNGETPPFPMTDGLVEHAWDIAGEAHEDPEEFDRYLERADAGDTLTAINGEASPVADLRDALFATQILLETIDRTNSTCMADVRKQIVANRAALATPPQVDAYTHRDGSRECRPVTPQVDASHSSAPNVLVRFREALGRIASNGFGQPVRDLCPKRDKDMLTMMEYARRTLTETALAQSPAPDAPRVATSREIMIAGGVDPDAPFERGPFPSEMRQAAPDATLREKVARIKDALHEPAQGSTANLKNAYFGWPDIERALIAVLALPQEIDTGDDYGFPGDPLLPDDAEIGMAEHRTCDALAHPQTIDAGEDAA